MNRKSVLTIGIATVWLAGLGGLVISAQDKYTVKVPGGLAFSEFKGYEAWQAISTSGDDKVVAVILGNPVMINAYEAGIPANGKPVPDGAKMAKVHWNQKKNQFFPNATVPGTLVSLSSPPNRCASSRLIASPKPVPPYFRDVPASACWNASKMIFCFSGAMPMPVSVTENCTTMGA